MKSVLRAAFASVVALFTVVYVLAVTVHVVPLSAATFEVRRVTDRFLEPVFAQRWSFFAPTPPELNTETTARARYIPLPDGAVRATGWLDISTYLDAATKQRPLAPSRRYRMLANIERGLVGGVVGREAAERRPFVAHPPTRAQVDAQRQLFQRRYQDLVLRVAADVLQRHGGNREQLQSVEVRVVASPISDFGQRFARQPPTRYLVWESVRP